MKTFGCILTLCLLLLAAVPVFSQPPDPGEDPGVPIDGGASLLVGAAVVYGAKKVKDRRNKRQDK